MNDRGDDTPEGELTDGILDQLAKYERAKIAERTRRGKLKKASEGKVIASHTPEYGFKYTASKDAYEVDEERMRVVRHIFCMAGTEGRSIHEITKILAAEVVRTPTGKKAWSRTLIRNFISDDVYKPHTYQQMGELVAPEVLTRLDSERCYGVWWFNRRKTKTTQTSVIGHDGKEYTRSEPSARQGRLRSGLACPYRIPAYPASGLTPRGKPSRLTASTRTPDAGAGTSLAALCTAARVVMPWLRIPLR